MGRRPSWHFAAILPLRIETTNKTNPASSRQNNGEQNRQRERQASRSRRPTKAGQNDVAKPERFNPLPEVEKPSEQFSQKIEKEKNQESRDPAAEGPQKRREAPQRPPDDQNQRRQTDHFAENGAMLEIDDEEQKKRGEDEPGPE